MSGFQLRRHLRQAVGFHAEKDHVEWSGPLRLPIVFGCTSKSPPSPTFDAEAMLFDGPQMGTAGEERNILARSRHARAEVTADSTGARD